MTIIVARPRQLEVRRVHVETGFDARFRDALDRALRERLRTVVMTLSRDGKTWSLIRWLLGHPVTVIETNRGYVRTTDVLVARASPVAPGTGLMYRTGSRITRIVRTRGVPFENTLAEAAINGGVRLVVIDDSGDLTTHERLWSRTFLDLLEHPYFDPTLEGVEVGIVYVVAGLPEGMPQAGLFAGARSKKPNLSWLQFEGRLDGAQPVQWIPGLDETEMGQFLTGLEQTYRDQFPDLELHPYTPDLFAAMLAREVDYAETGRVRTGTIVQLVLNALKAEAEAGRWGEGIGVELSKMAALLRARPKELADFALLHREIDDDDVPRE